MKKLLLFLLLSSGLLQAQEATILNRKNEVRTDLLSLIGSSKLNLTYERHLNKDFSVGITGCYANSNKVNDDFDSGYRNTLPKYEIIPFVRYNLSKGLSRYYFAEVFLDANGGDFKETVRRNNGTNADYYVIEKSNYSDLGIGGGLGYKMYIKDKFAIEFLVAFGTNLIDTDKSPDVLSRVGLSFGYRF